MRYIGERREPQNVILCNKAVQLYNLLNITNPKDFVECYIDVLAGVWERYSSLDKEIKQAVKDDEVTPELYAQAVELFKTYIILGYSTKFTVCSEDGIIFIRSELASYTYPQLDGVPVEWLQHSEVLFTISNYSTGELSPSLLGLNEDKDFAWSLGYASIRDYKALMKQLKPFITAVLDEYNS